MAHVLANDLRAAILQAAIQGNLTTQKDSDSDVYELISNAAKAMSFNEIDGRKVKKKNLSNNTINREFDIPDNWAWVQLGSICVIARGGSPRPIKSYLTNDESGVNWIKIGDTEKNGKYISSTKEKIIPEGVKKSRYVKAGDFLLTNSMSFGRPYILKIDGCIHDGWLVISQPYEVFIPDYLYYLLSSAFAYKQFCGLTSGAVVQNLNGDKVANAFFPLPPIEEQARIVAKVDEIMAKIDEYEKLENQLVKLKEQFPQDMKDSLLRSAFEGRMTTQNKEESVDTCIKSLIKNRKKFSLISQDEFNIPHNWTCFKFSDIFDIRNGFTPLRSNPDFWNNKDVPWFTIEDIRSQGRFITRTEQYISKKALSNNTKRILPKDTVLLCCTASVGEFAYSRIELTTNQQFNGLVVRDYVKSYINPLYVYYFVQTLKDKLIDNSGKTTFNFLSVTKLGKILIPIPPIEEQQRIVDKLDELLPLVEHLSSMN